MTSRQNLARSPSFYVSNKMLFLGNSFPRSLRETTDRSSTSPKGTSKNALMKAPKKQTKAQLVVLGWKDECWNVLDKVTVRNIQNDLVSFEILENYDRLIVLRLLSSLRPSCLVLFAEELQESLRTCTVHIGIHKKQNDPRSVVLAVLPSRDLSWGLAELHAQAYCGSPYQSAEILMREGEQLLLKFSGNITSRDVFAVDQYTEPHTLTFHNQRRTWLCLQLKEVDPFGNSSSPHYKGMATLFQIPKDQLAWRDDRAVISEDYNLGHPVCKLSLTLPKSVKTISRPISAKFLRHDQAVPLCEELLTWLCSELSEEDASLLVMCLRLRRSSVQLARLRAPNNLALQIFHILTTWRQALPSLTPKWPLLAHCLTRIGRPELAAELLKKVQTWTGVSGEVQKNKDL